MNGKLFPANAFGIGKLSSVVLSFSISSKLLVSSSLANSGTKGGRPLNSDLSKNYIIALN